MKTILLIDDDLLFLDDLGAVLTLSGYHVLKATTGREALTALDRHNAKLDLLIVDLVLPGLSGYEVIGAVNRRPNGIKVIATSRVIKDLYLEIATHIGAHATMRKPPEGEQVDAGAWLRMIDAVLQ